MNITIPQGTTRIAPMILDSKDEDVFIEDPVPDKYEFWDYMIDSAVFVSLSLCNIKKLNYEYNRKIIRKLPKIN